MKSRMKFATACILTAVLASCDQMSGPDITKAHIFNAVSNIRFYDFEGKDEEGNTYGALHELTPRELDVPMDCVGFDDEDYKLRLKDGKLLHPILQSDGYYDIDYVFEGKTISWRSPIDYYSDDSIEYYLEDQFGFQIDDITMNVMELEAPIDGYKAYEASGDIVYKGYPAKLEPGCIVDFGESIITSPYRIRFLDAGTSWRLINSGGERWEMPKDANGVLNYE